MRMELFAAAICCALCTLAFAQDDDLSALETADRAEARGVAVSPWSGFIEASASTFCGADRTCRGVNGRLALNLRYSEPIFPSVRAVFESRLDLNSRAQLFYPKRTNTLKEAYLAWHPDSRLALDAGRINVRYGVAVGYSPTDVFRARSQRTVVSIDPASTRANRLGVFAARGETLWDDGAVTAVVAPRLDDRRSAGVFSLDAGATNSRDRWLIVASQRLTPELVPQWLYYGEQGAEPRFGLNATSGMGADVVAFFEWMGGRERPSATPLIGVPAIRGFRNQATGGLTISVGRQATLTAEYQYNGRALDHRQWEVLAQAAPLLLLQYLVDARSRQDPPNRHSVFAHLRGGELLAEGVDLSAFTRINLDDRSQQWWVEMVRRVGSVDIALQWQANRGQADSEFGVPPARRAWQALVRYHF